jgi:uncharacterized protein YndB with AHSA1/START domain
MDKNHINTRVDTASRIIKADAATIYNAHIDPEAIKQWRPPGDMRCEIYEFDPRPGGCYRMAFIYQGDHRVQGKTSANADEFKGCFVELTPNKRIVESVVFNSEDEAYGGEMKIITLLDPVADGTKVTVRIENVPPGIKPEDHQEGIQSSLENLAAFTEQK